VTGGPSSGGSWDSATNSRHSSWLVPLITGTRLNCPLDSAVPIDWVSTLPSMSGVYPEKSSLSTMVATGRLRRHAAVWLAQPTVAANASPAASAVASGAWVRS